MISFLNSVSRIAATFMQLTLTKKLISGNIFTFKKWENTY